MIPVHGVTIVTDFVDAHGYCWVVGCCVVLVLVRSFVCFVAGGGCRAPLKFLSLLKDRQEKEAELLFPPIRFWSLSWNRCDEITQTPGMNHVAVIQRGLCESSNVESQSLMVVQMHAPCENGACQPWELLQDQTTGKTPETKNRLTTQKANKQKQINTSKDGN